MPSYDDAPHKRRNVKETWLHVIYHPATPGTTNTVRVGDGPEFQAHFTWDRQWRHVLPDANNDGTRELGPRLADTMRLYRKDFYVG